MIFNSSVKYDMHMAVVINFIHDVVLCSIIPHISGSSNDFQRSLNNVAVRQIMTSYQCSVATISPSYIIQTYVQTYTSQKCILSATTVFSASTEGDSTVIFPKISGAKKTRFPHRLRSAILTQCTYPAFIQMLCSENIFLSQWQKMFESIF